ncbi:uncharacterized protein Z520_04115 [Fonsecaea multimorphosa CBS 102226]|uniref:F-box domain-containing protein n=1 Tax=Fonsecaea multimorphosa CBS 102226 TaxID=1442371 RepID=A0A0D2KBE3_9EURO|nr:uncharacterized protein Z520_04115 [Fonsecaea multimorphosa CBS 102226]KIY00430.1 hypothetical protein Z520_04115 [Fonsecaea multimorphosa CBS 102226]OAL26945.1 hypothetical protein AYO22_03889 [Fonsecaea multimorphosa]
MSLPLECLPPEVLLRILFFLEIPDLLQVSRTCHKLREIACDPLLHLERLHHVSHTLSTLLARRPSKSAISPPNSWIWLSKTNVLSRQISKSLIRIRLSHNLEHRPSPYDLVQRAILPSTCTNYSSPVSPVLIQSQQAVQKSRLKDGLCRKLERRPSMNSLVSLNIMPEECARHSVSPAIVATRRKVIRESLKDGLRAWVEGRAIQAQKRKADEMDATEKITVKSLVRRFAARKVAVDLETRGLGRLVDPVVAEKRKAQAKWGREVELAKRDQERRAATNGACAQPTRAHVLGLKKFWEGVIRAAAG